MFLPLLDIQGVSVFYGKAIGIQEVSLSVGEKEAVGVIGPNGAGKTSLLRAISGLIPSTGTIRFKGATIDRKKAFEIARLGVILCPEGRGLFPELTVRQTLDIGAYGRKDAKGVRRDLEKAYTLFPVLKIRAAQLAYTLSGGEQQMLAIARAILAAPALLMLDEPSIGLALLVKERIAESIRAINKEGVTVLLMEQDAHLAMDIASRLYLLENGQVRLDLTADEMRDHPYVKEVYLGIS
jgi:branched-chain amino acid transport system ATP-binding protein